MFSCLFTKTRQSFFPLKTIFSRSSNLRRFGFALLSGLLLAMSFPKFNLWWLAWIVPGLLLLLSLGQPARTVLRVGYFAGLVQFLVGFYWLLLIPKPVVAIVAWLLVGGLVALYIAAWTWVCCRCFPKKSSAEKCSSQPTQLSALLLSISWQRRALWSFTCAAAWVAMEMGIARIMNGFPYSLGLSQFKLLSLIQIASVTGVYGISFLVVWISVALACAGLIAWRSRPALLVLARELAGPVLALAVIMVWGGTRLTAPEQSREHLKVALIQPGIPQSIIWDANERTNRLNKLVELSNAALAQHPDLLVWPEAALPPGMIGRTRDTQKLIGDLVRSNHVWMIFGVVDTAGARNEIELNSAFFIDPAGDLVSRYHKRKLVIFGEYMPLVRWLPFLKNFRAGGAGLGQGRGPVPFQMRQPRARISPLICFEDVFPHLTRGSVDSETDFLLNLTNNGWFGKSAAQWQHAIAALFRAIENGLPLVRCTNNGLTCWIDSVGRMHDVYFHGSTDIYQAGFKIVEIPLRSLNEKKPAQTIYNRYGDFFGWVCVMITLAIMTAMLFHPRQHAK